MCGDGVFQPFRHCLELQEIEHLGRCSDIGLRCKLRQIDVEWNITPEDHHFCIANNTLAVFQQARFQLWGLVVRCGNNRGNISVLHHQLRSSLFTNTWNSRKVVARVSTQCRVVGIQSRGHTRSLENSCFVIECVIADTTFVVQHTNVRVMNQLVTVSIARHDDDVVTFIFGELGHSGNEVVTFEARLFNPPNT